MVCKDTKIKVHTRIIILSCKLPYHTHSNTHTYTHSMSIKRFMPSRALGVFFPFSHKLMSIIEMFLKNGRILYSSMNMYKKR